MKVYRIVCTWFIYIYIYLPLVCLPLNQFPKSASTFSRVSQFNTASSIWIKHSSFFLCTCIQQTCQTTLSKTAEFITRCWTTTYGAGIRNCYSLWRNLSLEFQFYDFYIFLQRINSVHIICESILDTIPCNIPVRWSLKSHVMINGWGFLTLIDKFRVIITIILCNPCNMPKYVPSLEGTMHSPPGHALWCQTFGCI